MISEEHVKQLIVESLQNVKDSDSIYGDLVLDGDTILIGVGGPFDSIAFAAFATDFEEKIEDTIRKEYVLEVDEIFNLQKGRSTVTVSEMARHVTHLIRQNHGQ